MFTVEEICRKIRERETTGGNPMKVTPQRRLIFKALEGNDRHPTAEDIHNEVRAVFPDISLATVYKTLRELVEMREILEIKHEGESSRFDPRTDNHSHLVCDNCGRLEDVSQTYPDLTVPDGDRHGFVIRRNFIVFYGLCPDCQRLQLN
jgi:Fe2+ or Zn2+ uptake regulation protein